MSEIEEKVILAMAGENLQEVIAGAVNGDDGAIKSLKELILRKIQDNGLSLPDMSDIELAEEIYSKNYGLGVLEETYYDQEVDEIQINSDGSIYIVRRGIPEKLPHRLLPGEVRDIAKRLIMHDTGVSISETNPIAETVRGDDTRVTITCPPVSPGWCVALRKHDNVDMSTENLEKNGTLSKRLYEALALLVRGRCNILISGNFGAGKTEMLKKLFGETNPKLRTIVLESRRELKLAKKYPGRNIVELEEHAEVGKTMKKIFETAVVRMSPDIIIVGEFRGYGEASEAIRAGTKGHKGSMATMHSVSPYEAIATTAMMMLEEGLNLPLNQALLRVAKAYDVIVQMFYDPTSGVRMVESVTEISNNGEDVELRELIRWVPDSESYSRGSWEFISAPSERIINNLFKFGVSREEVMRIWN